MRKKVLTRKKPILMCRYEQKIHEQDLLIQSLRDQLEELNIENNQLQTLLKKTLNVSGPISIQRVRAMSEECAGNSTSPQFKISL